MPVLGITKGLWLWHWMNQGSQGFVESRNLTCI